MLEFWGHEVQPGTTVTFEVDDGFVIHLSQVALGKTKKGPENVVVFVKVGEKKLAIGTLSADKHPQISCDLIFDEAFSLSHNSKTTSVFFCGYKAKLPDMFKSDSGEDEDEELEKDEIPVKNSETEQSAAKEAKDGKKGKQNDDTESDDSKTSSGTDSGDEIPVKNNETEKSVAKGAKDGKKGKQNDNTESDDSETSSGTDSDDEIPVKNNETDGAKVGKKGKQNDDNESDDSETSSGTDDSMSEDDSNEEGDISSGTDHSEDEETTVKPEVGKKRAVATALKSPASDKKAKISTPKETGDKKSVHVATPYPAKQASKTSAEASKTSAHRKQKKVPKILADSKANEKSPKSGSHSCKSCSKTFNSAAALETHQKAKKHES